MGFLDDLGMGLQGFASTFVPMYRWNREQNRADELLSIQKSLKDLETQKLQMDLDDRKQANPYLNQVMGFLSGIGGQPQPSAAPGGGVQPGANVQPTPYSGATIKDLPLQTMNLLDFWGRWHGVPEEKLPFLYGIAAAESGGNQWAKADEKNGTSSHGMMQINDVNLGRLQPGENIYDPSVNTRIGAQIFKEGLDASKGNPNAALGAYASGTPNPSLPYVGRVLQAMGSEPTNPGTFQVAAAPSRSMSDASGPPPGIGGSGQQPQAPQAQGTMMPTAGGNVPAAWQSPQFLNLLVAGAMHPNKRISDASKTLLIGMKSGVDILNSRSPEYLSSLKVMEDFYKTANEKALSEQYKNPAFAGSAYIEQANKLRNDFESNKDVQTFNILGQAYSNIKSALQTPGREGDVALIYALMKIFDPNSVVRESEYAMAAAGRGAPEAVTGAFNKVMGGGTLLPKEREQFRKVVENMIQAQQGRYDVKKNFYTSIAKRYGIDPEHIITPSDPNNSYSQPQNAQDNFNPASPPDVAAEYDASGKRVR